MTSALSDDFDRDDILGNGDLLQVANRLTGNKTLNEGDIQQLIQYFLEEAALDDNRVLSFAEFEHIIEKSSNFSQIFRIDF
ncbi:calcium and integrin-binding family member 2-like [Phymastichus coffea]|uniref:calcium and integrin-binding family member 2-like n=1 Tax=Phymastichus coffea TaxID=108790 RepID=UPI00273CD1E8|nr:calcium and integrin-binding family member 2-like [Phymastichus coffea]